MPRKIISGCLCVWLFLGLATGCRPSGHTARHGAYGYFDTHFQDESQFIVETVVSDLAEQVYFAKFHKLPEADVFLVSAGETEGSTFEAPVYNVQIDLDKGHRGIKVKLNVSGAIWSPEIYDPVMTQLVQALGSVAGTGAGTGAETDAGLLAKLANDTATTIEDENQRLSAALQDDFTDPGLHERAAVLLGAFMLREHSGYFYEIRSPLCRMTAHLAMVRWLSGGATPGINGQVAGVMLLTLMNNQAAAVQSLGGIKTNNAALLSWTRALQALNTGDYRPLDKVDGLSRIESTAWFSALHASANSDIAWGKLSDSQKQVADFSRIASEGHYSVGLGHELLTLALPAEYEELSGIYEQSQKKKLTQKNLAKVLNQMPDRCFSVGADGKLEPHIIGWGLWAGFFQRQLCHAVEHNFDFMQHGWGVPDDAKEFATKCNGMFDGLRLYPFVRRFNAVNEEEYHKSVDDGFKVTVATPQLVPPECWNYLCYELSPGVLYQPNPNPHVNEWHSHNPPPGTAYNPYPRLDHPSLTSHPGAVERLHVMAPYDCDIAWYIWANKYNRTPNHEQALELYRPVLEYDDNAMQKVAESVRNNPLEYEKLMSRAAQINPSLYFSLGDYFSESNPDKAAGYLEKGTALDPDSVRAANRALWLVKYYLKNNRIEDARKEADFAGEVYSYSGLEAKAWFLEATKDYDGAHQWYANIKERYEDAAPLIAFCAQYKATTGDTRFDAEVKSNQKAVFPMGLEKVELGGFSNPPTDGVLLKTESTLSRAAGLKAGDVIVAFDGIRVHNTVQYQYQLNDSAAPGFDLIVWQGSAYHEIKASPPNHRFQVELGNYSNK